MSLYTAASEEALRARRELKQWAADGRISHEQYEQLDQDTVEQAEAADQPALREPLRTTNIFLRIVLFFFTALGVAAAVGLFFTMFLKNSSRSANSLTLLVFAALSYAAAEILVAQARLYRHGMEEALAASAVVLLCAGLDSLLFTFGLPYPHTAQAVVPAAGALACLWIWYRFGLWYHFPAAMIFAAFLPGCWSASHAAQLGWIATLYVAGLIVVALTGKRHRDDYLARTYSLAEAFLWLGLYVDLNLKISFLTLPMFLGWVGMPRVAIAFSRPFYWTTWVLIWCLPALILSRGIRQKDRFVLAVGVCTALLTFLTNKPYLGWQRHTWDPMLLGIALTAVAFSLRRWLDRGPNGARHSFTAARLSAKDKHLLNSGSAILGLFTPHATAPSPQQNGPDNRFGGGSGGGGASGDF